MIGPVWQVIGNAMTINPVIHNILIPTCPRGRAYQLAKKAAITEVLRAINSYHYEVDDSELEE